MTGTEALIILAYLLASVLFIIGLKGLAHPRTAVRGNKIGALGMFIAIVVTLMDKKIISFEIILAGIILGGLIGGVFAVKIAMTAMPQLVGLFNGFGGAASLLVAGAALIEAGGMGSTQLNVATVASGIIGSVTFWGSFIAFGKLQGFISGGQTLIPARHIINILLVSAAMVIGYMIVSDPLNTNMYWYLVIVASFLGVLLVIPIGGADMPVVVSLLNSYSGIAAAATGFVLNNNGLIIAGSLVGASGIILSKIMCVAMNRSLINVLFAKFSVVAGEKTKADDIYEGKIKSTNADEIAMLLDGVQRVVIVPGYGMAVSQAQHAVRDFANLLESKGVEIEYAIHPVAGRMPGHMNVLLAEADIPYEKLKEMDAINPTLDQTDVAIVVGANDVVNPVARTDPSSPIAGMPIIDVDKARTVVVIKRSLSPGFAGIPNPLFAADNTLMFFGDGRKAIVEINNALQDG
ncbi:NAD(P)(+) transhydrogenase (Re/Si-specific) subunit beta [candidate division KSB1 bacterium]|nr:NAD(P)(+) transhydrogenase (Re/Si-specific) subunit beta [candidate division KSB1 bacterium]